MMDELSEFFNIEVNEFQKKAKVRNYFVFLSFVSLICFELLPNFIKNLQSEEEIEKWCTKTDLTELQRAVFLLKKGYEV